jgi:hypothetical protein
MFMSNEVRTRRAAWIFLFAAALAFVTPRATGAQENRNPDQITVPFSDPNRPGTLQIHLVQAGISVSAHDGRDVIITAKGRNAGNVFRPDPQAAGLRRISSGGFSVTENNNVVSVRNDRFGDSVMLDIQVPAKTNLKVDVMNSENLRLEGIDGDIEATVLNGGLTATNVAGSVVAHSTNGNVKVTMQRVTPQKPMAFTSVNGNVDVTLPTDTKANLKLRTTRGDIYTDFDVQMATSVTNTNGQDPPRRFGPRFRIDLETLGSINGGGPDFEVRTVNGNVYIRKGQ